MGGEGLFYILHFVKSFLFFILGERAHQPAPSACSCLLTPVGLQCTGPVHTSWAGGSTWRWRENRQESADHDGAD